MSAFTGLLQQFEETQRISDRRKRHLTDWQQAANGVSCHPGKLVYHKFPGPDGPISEPRGSPYGGR